MSDHVDSWEMHCGLPRQMQHRGELLGCPTCQGQPSEIEKGNNAQDPMQDTGHMLQLKRGFSNNTCIQGLKATFPQKTN